MAGCVWGSSAVVARVVEFQTCIHLPSLEIGKVVGVDALSSSFSCLLLCLQVGPVGKLTV